MSKIVRIDISNIKDKKELFQKLKEAGLMPREAGENLDALHDVLTDIGEETSLVVYGKDSLIEYCESEELAEYVETFSRVLDDAAEENPGLTIQWE
ncbi:MAG: barstar family protein [Firmicutes bacterium]|nr:barstar family protein [Bacillota bacterium]